MLVPANQSANKLTTGLGRKLDLVKRNADHRRHASMKLENLSHGFFLGFDKNLGILFRELLDIAD